jgi:hypothetical protein
VKGTESLYFFYVSVVFLPPGWLSCIFFFSQKGRAGQGMWVRRRVGGSRITENQCADEAEQVETDHDMPFSPPPSLLPLL